MTNPLKHPRVVRYSSLIKWLTIIGVGSSAVLGSERLILGFWRGSSALAMAPIHREIQRSADTLAQRIDRNRWEARRSVDSLRTDVRINAAVVNAKLDILLQRSRTR